MPQVSDFRDFDAGELGRLAMQNGFFRKGTRTWVRRTQDFVQLLNIQHSHWSKETHYLNFALWPLALGEPPSFSESRFLLRTRAESMGARSLEDVLDEANRLTSLVALAEAIETRRISGLVSKDLRPLLA